MLPCLKLLYVYEIGKTPVSSFVAIPRTSVHLSINFTEVFSYCTLVLCLLCYTVLGNWNFRSRVLSLPGAKVP